MSTPSAATLRQRIEQLTLRDADRLGRRLSRRTDLRRLAAQVDRAEALIARRAVAVPEITYPPLPVSERREDIAAAIRDHQVIVLAGETGSGKTTQLPKICLEIGRGIQGTIGHTQPRRLAARTVAARIADELHTPLGDVVGYTIRFTDHISDRTLVRLMTDGILLAEIQRDPRLLRYDTIIVDEAHERSLNIDFLLGYLTSLLPRRPDLKLIITSATIDPQRFADHFAQRSGANGGISGAAPIVEVSGRTYPVEIRYRPLEADVPTAISASARRRRPVVGVDGDDPDDPDHEVVHRIEARDQTEGIVDAAGELMRDGPGDILVFLSGEREIRDTAEALRGLDAEVLPLYARLSTAEQHRVFAPHPGRRIVLATNVAETSLTVPGIHYVIDPGTARISRYSRRTKVQRLPIEPISQASAAQRAGRSGRTAKGICIRLYSERDFDSRPRFTEPEILRTNLASVILQMKALGLGDLDRFPFVEPPDRRSVRDGMALLQELNALDGDGELTAIGRTLAQLPVDPRIGRMIVEAQREGCVREVLVIAAALSIPDPRERPLDQEEAARQKHARFADEHSDFIGYLNLWNYLREQRHERSGNQFRRMCREEFLHYLRIREWQDLVAQLRQIAKSLDIEESDQPADAASIHNALLAGLLAHVGMRLTPDRATAGAVRTPGVARSGSREYQGARNSRFLIAPGSTLARRPPPWVVAAELVETSRLYARVAARVEPAAIERLAGHLVVRTYSEPEWDRRRGAAMARERVTLYGLPLVAGRRVQHPDPAEARELFIRHALVEGDWDTRHRFFHENRELLDEVATVEERARRRDLLVGDEELFAFYDRRIPVDVVSTRHFDAWWKKARHESPNLLTLTRPDVLRGEPAEDQPVVWRSGDVDLPVTYRFEPGAADDGVTVYVPLNVLARLGGTDFSWQVPALREELVTALIRSLPKDVRRNFVPAPDTARAVLAAITPGQEPLLEAVQRELYRRSGVLVPLDAFDLGKVPAHLRVTFAVEDENHGVLARGRDLGALQAQLAAPARAAVATATGLEREGLREWPADLETLPQVVARPGGVHGYPAFVDEEKSVAVRVFATEAEQRGAAAAGLRRLIRLTAPSPVKGIALSRRARLLGVADTLDECADAAVDSLLPALVWDRPAFVALRDSVQAELPAATREVAGLVEQVLAAAQDVRLALRQQPPPAQAEAFDDMRAQLVALLRPGFVTAAGRSRLRDLVRYIRAIGRRVDRLPREVEVDRARMQRVHQVQAAYRSLVRALPPARANAPDVQDIRWSIEELRVSLFAQQLGTARPVSEQRIYRAIDSVTL
jgi:ATP-dependent helicase HrpA